MEKPVKLAMTTVTKGELSADRDKQEAGPERTKEGSSLEMREGSQSVWLPRARLKVLGCPAFPDCFFYEWFCPKQQMNAQEGRCEG